jgi:hypothetical protein
MPSLDVSAPQRRFDVFPSMPSRAVIMAFSTFEDSLRYQTKLLCAVYCGPPNLSNSYYRCCSVAKGPAAAYLIKLKVIG